MPRRLPKGEQPLPSPFKYKSVAECEENTPDGKHIVRPTAWPPQRLGRHSGEPSMALSCELCNGRVIVYAKHATGEIDGVTVILPDKKKSA